MFSQKPMNVCNVFTLGEQRLQAGEAGIISEKLVESMVSMIGLRNLLVHDYATADLKLVFEFLQSKLGNFVLFMKDIASLFTKVPS